VWDLKKMEKVSMRKSTWSRLVPLPSLALAFTLMSPARADSQSDFARHKEEIRKESSLIRYYTFEEGRGEEVRNHVEIGPGRQALSGGPLGSLYIQRNSPYGLSRFGYYNTPDSTPSSEWTAGRWSWKSALTPGLQKRCLFRSGVDGEEFKSFTLQAWIRVHEHDADRLNCSLFTIGSAYKSGLSIHYGGAGNGYVNFRMGTPGGAESVGAAPFSAGVWHQLTCSYDGKALRIFIDGKLSGEKACQGAYIAPKNVVSDQYSSTKAFIEGRGSYLQIGGKPTTRDGEARFDIGELAIYTSALPAETVQRHFESGKPESSPEQQLTAFREFRKQVEKTRTIGIGIPNDTWGYFPLGSTIPLTVSFPENSGFQGDYRIECVLTDLKGVAVWQEKASLRLENGRSATREIAVPAKTAGIFFLDVLVKDSQNRIVKSLQEKYCLGFTAVPVVQKDISPLNPLGIQACLNPWMWRNMPLYRQFVWGKTYIPKSQVLAREMMQIGPTFPPMVYTLVFDHDRYRKIGPKEEQEIRDYVTESVKGLKDSAYCWEITNEPNGKFSPETYMKLLKICSEIMRRETPEIKILAPGASPSGIPFINRLMEMGAAEYMDVLTFHNYSGPPISSYRWNNTAAKLQKIVDTYAKGKMPIWNSESGIFCLPRIGERPMTVDEGTRAGFTRGANRIKPGFNTSMSTYTEQTAAATQVQSILLDFASGYQKYIKCQGPSLPGLEGTNTITLPTLPGVALTALSTVVNTMVKAEELPLSSMDDACVVVTNQQGRRTAVAFSDKTPTLSFKVAPGKTCRGMDMLGNPLSWQASAGGLILVQLGEDPIYIFDIPADFQQIAPLKVSCPEKLADNQLLAGTIAVTNPFDVAMNATLSAVDLEGASLTLDRTEIQLAPGKTINVPFSLKASALKRRQYEIQFNLKAGNKLIAAASALFDSPGSVVRIPETKGAIVLDGDDAEWARIPMDVAQDEENVVHGKPNLAELWLPQWRGNDDLSFTAQYTWRKNDALYLLIKVKDNKPLPAPEGQEGLAFRWDCLELFFDSRPYGKRGGPVSQGADQTIVIPRVASETQACIQWQVQKDKAAIGVEFVGRRTADGYLLEGKITPKKDSPLKLRAGTQFCMDLLFDDTDDMAKLRKAAMTLHGTFNNYTDSGQWGRYQLGPALK
jgi:hypothetical protein